MSQDICKGCKHDGYGIKDMQVPCCRCKRIITLTDNFEPAEQAEPKLSVDEELVKLRDLCVELKIQAEANLAKIARDGDTR